MKRGREGVWDEGRSSRLRTWRWPRTGEEDRGDDGKGVCEGKGRRRRQGNPHPARPEH